MKKSSIALKIVGSAIAVIGIGAAIGYYGAGSNIATPAQPETAPIVVLAAPPASEPTVASKPTQKGIKLTAHVTARFDDK